MKTFQNIIFDLDGTLIDSSKDIISCLDLAYKRVNINHVKINNSHVGPKISLIINQLTPDIYDYEKDMIINYYREIYDNLKIKNSVLYDGVLETLNHLKSKDKQLFIATNKPDSATLPLLDYFNIRHFFKDVLTPTSIKNKELNKSQMISYIIKKYNLIKYSTTMVGDHPDDIEAARNNNLVSIAVLYGYSPTDVLKSCKPNFEINNILDISL